LVFEQIRRNGKEPARWQETSADASAQTQARRAELETKRSVIERDVNRWMAEMRALALEVGQSQSGGVVARLSDIQKRIRGAEERTRAIDDEKLSFERGQVHENEVGLALAGLDAEWETLSPREQTRIVQLLVERVDYDGAARPRRSPSIPEAFRRWPTMSPSEKRGRAYEQADDGNHGSGLQPRGPRPTAN
jgi:site-specific DNA recombinase